MTVFPLPHIAKANEYVSFFDESHITGHKFMTLGGVLCRPDCGHGASLKIEEIKSRPGLPGSVQWKNLSSKNYSKHEQVIDFFFDENESHCIDFCALVLNTRKFDHKRYNRGSHEEGFNKFMFQYFFRWAKQYGQLASFRCFPDRRDSAQSLDDIKRILNSAAQKRFSSGTRLFLGEPFREVKYSSTSKEPLLQVSDILLGAIGASWNKRLRPDSPKSKLADHIRKRAGLETLARPTNHGFDHHFKIWEFDLDPKNGSPWA